MSAALSGPAHVFMPSATRYMTVLSSLRTCLATASFFLAATTVRAQTPGGDVRQLQQATRAELENRATQAERAASGSAGSAEERSRKRAEADALRGRLRDGDFLPGDRLVVSVEGGEKAFADTLVVRAGQTVLVPDIGEIPLRGVLRSELQEHMQREVARYLKNPTVHATSLIRLAVLGGVGKPGFYALPSDILLSDAIMAAGGPGTGGDVNRTEVRRGGKKLLDRDSAREALQQGTTLDQLSLRAGDEVVVGERKSRDWRTMAYLTTSLLGLAYAVLRITNR
jgi:protein involved in polysaccharide export with SLBB domain